MPYDPEAIMRTIWRRFVEDHDSDAMETFLPWLRLKQQAADISYDSYYRKIEKLAEALSMSESGSGCQ